MTKNGKCVKISISVEQDNKTNLNCYYAVKGSTKMEEIAQFNSATQGLDLYICLDKDEPSNSRFTPTVLEKIDVHKNQNKTKMITLEKKQELCPSYADLSSAANYLIQLFYSTDCKYSCTRTKLGKLLSITAFIYAKNKIKLFAENICEYKKCGTTFAELPLLYSRDIYLSLNSQDSNDFKPIGPVMIDMEKIPSAYKIVNLPMDVRYTLKNVFETFGGFHASKLGDYITYIIDCNKDVVIDGKVNLDRLLSLLSEDQDGEIKQENRAYLLNYIRTFKC